MHLSMSMIFSFKDKYSETTRKFTAITTTALAVIVMFYLPIKIYDDFWVDMRLIPLLFLAYFQGWKVAIPTLFITSSWRFFMGGGGMIPGIIFGMVLPTLIGLLFHHRSNIKGNFLEKLGIIIAAWFVCDFPIIFFMPNGLEVFNNIALIRSTTFVITAIVLYTFIMQDRQRRYLQEKFEKLAGEDSLTKLRNKRKFFEVVEEKRKHVKSRQFLAMLDLDHFKNINDTFGHIVGDKILSAIGEILKKYESDNVVIGRYGGEEFIIYIESDDCRMALQLIQNIRNDIRSSLFKIGKGNSVKMTVSIGLAEFDNDITFLEAVNLADKRLYKAKEKGRDCVVCENSKKIC